MRLHVSPAEDEPGDLHGTDGAGGSGEGEGPEGRGGVHDSGDAGVHTGFAEREEQVGGGVGDQ